MIWIVRLNTMPKKNKPANPFGRSIMRVSVAPAFLALFFLFAFPVFKTTNALDGFIIMEVGNLGGG